MSTKRRLPKRTVLPLFGTGLVFVGFTVGIYVAHYRMFPYDAIISVYWHPKAVTSYLRNSMPQISFLAGSFLTARDGGSSESQILHTHLYALKREEAHLPRFIGKGGAIASLGRDLLVLTPRGRIVVISLGAKEGIRVDGRVPMENPEWEASIDHDSSDIDGNIRVAGILLTEVKPEIFHLFVAHHYFTGECIRFRLSSTILSQERDGVNILPQWRTLFDAEPCMAFGPRKYLNLDQSGGRMLMDGPHHLLLSIGDHGQDGRILPPDDPASHLGKLVRVEIATGVVQVLTVGHRNPQGMVRGRDGRVWATEHGPWGGDELNLLQSGDNYGWPYVSYGTDRLRIGELNSKEKRIRVPRVPGLIGKGKEVEATGRHEGFKRPVFAWVRR